MQCALGLALVLVFGVAGRPLPAQRGRGELPADTSPDGQRCSALASVVLPDLSDAPARVLSARLVNVPAGGLTNGRGNAPLATPIR